MSVTYTLPWPADADLKPNGGHGHWSKPHRAKKKYKKACALSLMEQRARPINAERLRVAVTFYPPARYHYDMDNLIARMKAGFDALSDALGVDDSRWQFAAPVLSDDRRNIVQVSIEPIGGEA